MTTNRLPYETSAGNLSAETTFKQLIEHIRLAEEDMRTMAVIHIMRADRTFSEKWTLMANKMNLVRDIVTEIATGKSQDRTTVGYEGNA